MYIIFNYFKKRFSVSANLGKLRGARLIVIRFEEIQTDQKTEGT